MTLWCSMCLATHELTYAATITDGQAVCVRHFAQISAANGHMTAEEIDVMIRREYESTRRADELGRRLGVGAAKH